MFEELKSLLVLFTGISRDALHTQLGLLIFIAVALIWGLRAGSIWPISVVMLAALLGEAFDYLRDISTYGVWNSRESIHDIANTVFWPSVIFVMVKSGRVFSRQ